MRNVSASKAGRCAASPRRPRLCASKQHFATARPNTRALPLTDEWNDTWSVGVAVTWTAFDGGKTRAAEAQARARAEALRRQLEDAEERVRLEVTQRVLDLESATAALGVARRTLEAATENERVSRDRYFEGMAPSSDLLDAETYTLRAGLDVTTTLSSLQIANAQLARAVGR